MGFKQRCSSTTFNSFNLNAETSKGALSVPLTGTMALDGREAKIIPVDYTFGRSQTKVLYSTAEIMTWTT